MFPSISFRASSVCELACAIRSASSGEGGVLILEDLPHLPPFDSIADLFSLVESDSTFSSRLNSAYTNNLVYKDSHHVNSSHLNLKQVDRKRVIDLSPERLQIIQQSDPLLMKELRNQTAAHSVPESTSPHNSPLDEIVDFFNETKSNVIPKLLTALNFAIGSKLGSVESSSENPAGYKSSELRFNYRLVDYYSRPANESAPRCGQHQDFGPFTLIFQHNPNASELNKLSESAASSGLEVLVNDRWVPIDYNLVNGSNSRCVLLFGISTAWRSNHRIHASMHRVIDSSSSSSSSSLLVNRRLSAVLFVGLSENTVLSPVLLDENEKALFRSAKVAEVGSYIRRKWRHREGTLPEAQTEEELETTKQFPSQMALVEHIYGIEQ